MNIETLFKSNCLLSLKFSGLFDKPENTILPSAGEISTFVFLGVTLSGSLKK